MNPSPLGPKGGKVQKRRPNRGNKIIAPKTATGRELLKAQKSVTKGINQNIERELANRAKQCEEGKAFNLVKVADKADGKKKK